MSIAGRVSRALSWYSQLGIEAKRLASDGIAARQTELPGFHAE